MTSVLPEPFGPFARAGVLMPRERMTGKRERAGANSRLAHSGRAVAPVTPLLPDRSELVDLAAAGDSADEQVKALSEDELARLLSEIPDEHRLFFEFLAQSGCRISEAVEFRWQDLDLGTGTLRVSRRFYRGKVAPPKSKFGRRLIRLSPGLSRALWTLRKETRAADDELVFTAERGSRIDMSNLMSRVLKPAAVEAGVGRWMKTPSGLRADTWVGFHTFRHTCASMLFRAGWNAAQVQRHLGHHKASFTLDTYIHLLDEDVPVPTFFDSLACASEHAEAERPSRALAL